MTDLYRNAEIAKIKIGQKDLGLDDETYRALLLRLTKRRSAAKLSTAQRRTVLEHMKREGAFKDRPRVARSPLARKIHALWRDLEKTGAIRQPGPAALRSYCGRMVQPGQESVLLDPDFLTTEDAIIVVEGLKAWLARVKREHGK